MSNLDLCGNSLILNIWVFWNNKIYRKCKFHGVWTELSSGETRKTKQKLEVFNYVFRVSSLVFFAFFRKPNVWKTCKCFWFRSKTFLLKKTCSLWIFFCFLCFKTFELNMRRNELNLQKQTKNVHKFQKDTMFIKKKVIVKIDKMANKKKRKFENMVRRSDWYIN